MDCEVEVVYAPAPGQVFRQVLRLPAPATVGQAIEASGVLSKYPDLTQVPLAAGVFARPASLDAQLQPGDRVELYRPLAARRSGPRP